MICRPTVLCAFALVAAAPAATAQSEAALREYFEGRTVTVKIAMPGTENGVDIYPGAPKPLDYPRHADRLKDYGTAIKSGSQALVTKVKLKGDHIEFQLDGGGYGTMGDETSSSVSVAPTPKTKREQNLEGELKRTTDPGRRRDIKEELDDLKTEREREDARNRAAVADAQEMKKANIRQRRLEGGSRFNIRYRNGIPDSALTPVGVQAALAQYVDFGTATPTTTSGSVTPIPGTGESTATASSGGMPRKGMLLSDVDRLFGPPQKTSDRPEGKLKVTTRVYQADAGRISAEFVEGVLIRYTLISN